ncbi:MAG: hypothetical protein K2M36_00695, partial [Clostridia bacterium]|nr:hypothetical protein [Clostridia bacterium]
MQRRKTTIIVLVTVLAILLSSTVLFSVVPGNSADALTTAQVSSAVKAGGGADLWNSATSTWNATVLSDMVSKIFPVTTTWESYIKNNGSEDYTRVGKNSPNVAEKDIPYYVVPASTINARVGSANYGMVVKLDGKDWMVTSLTIDRDDNIVVTLMLATPNDSAVGTTKYWGTAGETKGNNMYARSLVRSKLLSSSYFSLFSTAGAGSFAEKYLVQPKNIQYQRTETQYNRAKSGEVPENVNGNIPNDALGSLTSGWDDKTYKVNYQPSDTFPDASGNMVRYDAWGDDYIWLPSVTETGNNGSIPTSCIWKLTSYQRSHSSSTAFTRSGDANGWQNVYPLTSTGAHGGDSCTSTGSVRPAIHLNLSAIAKVTPITSDIY